MISYPYIKDLFTNILSKSKGIDGRFFISTGPGREINNDDLNQVIQDIVAPPKKPKYPLALMLPPRCSGDFTGDSAEWERYQITMFFLKTTFVTRSGQTQTMNENTRTSTHSVMEDWHDMKRCAVSFITVLNRLQRKAGLINTFFRLDQKYERTIQPVSLIGVDRLSGVRLDFIASLFNACDREDYTEQDIATIVIPTIDSHPEHKL